MGAFHYAKEYEISIQSQIESYVLVPFVRNIQDRLLRLSRLRSEFSDRNLPFHFDKSVHCPNAPHLRKEFGTGKKNAKSYPSWLARFHRKILFHFPRIFPLVCDRSLWHDGKHSMLSDLSYFQKAKKLTVL